MDNYLNGNLFSSYIGTIPPIDIPCKDQVVFEYRNGQLLLNRQDIDYVTNGSNFGISNNLTNPVVVVLESPHKSEFSSNMSQHISLGPAKGTTGRLFKSHFINLIQRSIIWPGMQVLGNFDLVFINAVQFQCSFGKNMNKNVNKMTKEENWLLCFKNGCGADMITRITAINPKAVINLCTKGFKNLQLCVDNMTNNSINYTIGSHPSTWNFNYAYIK